MKRFLFWLLVIGIVCFGAHDVQASPQEAEPAGEPAAEESAEAMAREQAEGLELDRVGEFWNNILTEYGGHLPESQKGSLLEFVKGEKHFSPEEWSKALFSYLFHEVLANGKLLGTLILLTIFCVLLQLLQKRVSAKHRQQSGVCNCLHGADHSCAQQLSGCRHICE